MIIAVYVVWGMYFIFLIVIITLWKRIKLIKSSVKNDNQFSVIIPIRNEEENIEKLLLDLNNQSYSNQKFEVLVVNDHSTDNGKEIVLSLIQEVSYPLKLIDMPTGNHGKKAAITEGVRKSKNEIIVTTDGDCRVATNWLTIINSAYKSSTMFVFGRVGYHKSNNLFGLMQNIEMSVLGATGGVQHYLNIAGMCNGANLSFRKKAFNDLNGYSGNADLPTGDDEFLLRKMISKYPQGIEYIKNHENLVFTMAMHSWNGLLNQKIRWASKWKRHKDWFTKLFGLFIITYNIVCLVTLFFAFFNEIITKQLALLLTLKVALELILMLIVIPSKVGAKTLLASALLSIIYPFYTIFIGVLSLQGKYKWKDRSY